MVNVATSPSFPNGLPHLRSEAEVRVLRAKPCPWCGHDVPLAAKPIGRQFKNYIVGCENENCPAQPSVSGETPELAMQLWNRRA